MWARGVFEIGVGGKWGLMPVERSDGYLSCADNRHRRYVGASDDDGIFCRRPGYLQ